MANVLLLFFVAVYQTGCSLMININETTTVITCANKSKDILSLNCELLSERIKLIQFSKECPPDLISCISTLMYAAPRVDIPELLVIRKQFTAKYGKQFAENAMTNVGGILNERVVVKLSVQPPAAFLVQTYLEQICEKYEVDWSPNSRLSIDQMGEPMAPPSGFSVPIGQGTGLGPAAHTGMTINGEDDVTYDGEKSMPPPQAPKGSSINGSEAKTEKPAFDIPTAPGSSNPLPPSEDLSKGDDDDESNNNNQSGTTSNGKDSASYNELAARFENLKNL